MNTPAALSMLACLAWMLLPVDSAGAAETLRTAQRDLFRYDSEVDFAVVEQGKQIRDGALIRDVSFAVPTPDGRRVTAYIVTPQVSVKHPWAGILWVHWLGEPATTNRTEFLEEAVALAKHGVVSVLPDAMWSQPNWYSERKLEEDFPRSVRQVIELRRALDLLRSQVNVDTGRIGVVAHDYGAMFSAVAIAVHGGVRTNVWIAPTASFTDWAFYEKKPASMQDYLAQNRPLQLTDYLRATHGVSTLMQFAGLDNYVPAEKAAEFAAAVNERKRVCIYPQSHHDMTEPAAIRAARTAWLARELAIAIPDLPAAPVC